METEPITTSQVKHVLVVDDSRVVRRVSRKMLEAMGFEVSEAVNGEEAIATCHATLPHAILLDWRMPVLDGLSCLRTIRRLGFSPQPAVIFCTTENAPERIQAAIDAGADEYVMKPFDREILETKLVYAGVL
ncbi:MAG: response regulator [Pseudomonadota bacterium]